MQGFSCRSTSKRTCITIEFRKVFETLQWDAIYNYMMELFGYNDSFRKKVMDGLCPKLILFSIIEGFPTEVFQAQRGIKQGDPLSPLLFVMAIEYLSQLTKKVVEEKKLQSYMNGGATIEPQLAFADDITFFSRASIKSFNAINDILEEFIGFIGLQVNRARSYAAFSRKVHDGNFLSKILGFQVKSLPVKYLGIPLTGKSISHKDYDCLIAQL